MKICLNTSTIKPVPLLEKIKLVGEAGFAGIELWLNDVWEFVARGGEVSEISRALDDHGLIVPSVIAMRQWGDFEGWEHQLVSTKREGGLHWVHGWELLIVATPGENPETSHLAPGIKNSPDRKRGGNQPTFEYISFFKSVHTLKRAWEIVQEADDPDATLILDAFHNWNSASTSQDLMDIPLERISHYHIDDADPQKPALTQTDPDRVMPGDGQIDLQAEIKLLKEKGYDGTVSLELFNQDWWAKDPKGNPQSGVRASS